MSSINIVIVLPSLGGGGAERLHVNLANHWVEQGFSVTFALMRMEGDLVELLHRNVNLIDLGAPRIRDVPFSLARAIKKLKPDITIVAMWPLTTTAVLGWMLSGRIGRLFLSDHTALSVANPYETKTSISTLAWSMRLSYRFANGLIAVSEGVKQDMCNLSGLHASKIRVIYNPAAKGIKIDDSLRFDPKGLWKGHKGFKILSVGSLKTQKDHKTLLKALALLPETLDTQLVILGEGPLRGDLSRLAEELGVASRLSLPGFVLDPYPWFSSADLFVLTSRWEGFGNVLVEALECGTPVVSTDCISGPSEILANGRYGHLVPVQDPVMLALAIEASFIKKHDRHTLRQRASEFSVGNISKKYIDYFLHV
jgi:glycosyltransferase involved in cell wall biosynthesis